MWLPGLPNPKPSYKPCHSHQLTPEILPLPNQLHKLIRKKKATGAGERGGHCSSLSFGYRFQIFFSLTISLWIQPLFVGLVGFRPMVQKKLDFLFFLSLRILRMDYFHSHPMVLECTEFYLHQWNLENIIQALWVLSMQRESLQFLLALTFYFS